MSRKPSEEEIDAFDRDFERSSGRFSIMVWLGAAIIIGAAVVAANFTKPTSAEPYRYYNYHGAPDIFTDLESGCQYLIFRNGGVTPRLGADGMPICVRRQDGAK